MTDPVEQVAEAILQTLGELNAYSRPVSGKYLRALSSEAARAVVDALQLTEERKNREVYRDYLRIPVTEVRLVGPWVEGSDQIVPGGGMPWGFREVEGSDHA